MRFLVVLALASLSLLEAKKCNVEYEVLYQIASNERHPARAIGYPYLINFNNTEEMKNISSLFDGQYEMLDKRTVDCKNINTCVAIYEDLKGKEINNIDLGAFSINPKYHSVSSPKVFFELKDSMIKVCSILEELNERYGWGWKTIGRYHSGTPKFNIAYTEKIKHRIQRN